MKIKMKKRYACCLPLFLFVRDYLRVENRHVMLRLHILTVVVKR